MAFLRIRFPGMWGVGSVAGAAEFEALDAMRPDAIDGGAGGTYAPTGLLSIGGLATTLNPTTLTLSPTTAVLSGTWSGTVTETLAVTKSGDTATTAIRVGTLDGTTTTQTLYVTKDIWYTNGTTFVGTATYTISDTGAANGHVIKVAVLSLPGARTIDFKKPGGTTILSATGAGHVFVEFTRMGGVWFVTSYSGAATFVE